LLLRTVPVVRAHANRLQVCRRRWWTGEGVKRRGRRKVPNRRRVAAMSAAPSQFIICTVT